MLQEKKHSQPDRSSVEMEGGLLNPLSTIRLKKEDSPAFL